jgi:hypothetical protein
MIKNKWKVAFWICFILLLSISVFGIYSIIDQAVTITYMKEGYTNTKNDLNTLIQIINSNDLSKRKIKENLEGHRFYDMMEFGKDTIGLERVDLVFENDTLRKIINQ